MCFAGFVFACFVFASVFISEEGEPSWVCQAPVSMQAIISPTPLKSMYVWGNVHVLRAHRGVWRTDRGRSDVHFGPLLWNFMYSFSLEDFRRIWISKAKLTDRVAVKVNYDWIHKQNLPPKLPQDVAMATHCKHRSLTEERGMTYCLGSRRWSNLGPCVHMHLCAFHKPINRE